jgi:uncharacterized protein (DUF302 family)
MQVEGLTVRRSAHDFATTLGRFTDALQARAITIFATIDHAAGASRAGLALRPTTLVIFGNPKAGTPVMQGAQTAGIDLPLKALIWQDEAGSVWLATNDPAWIAQRHHVPATDRAIAALADALAALAEHATSHD